MRTLAALLLAVIFPACRDRWWRVDALWTLATVWLLILLALAAGFLFHRSYCRWRERRSRKSG